MQAFRTKPITESEFLGYDDLHPSELLSPGKFQKADNVLLSDNVIKKVTGSSAINSSAIAAFPFNGLSDFEIVSSGNKWIIANVNGTSNADIYYSTGGNFTKISAGNITNSQKMYFETANNILYGFNQKECFSWDGTTFTKNPSGVPIGLFAAWFHNFLFVANTSSFPNRVYFSNLGDPTTFQAANFVDINPGDGDSIQGFGVLQDELFVFKKETIWSITGWSGTTFSATTVATQNTNLRLIGYGCVAPNSIIPIGNEIYFLSFLGGSPVIRSLRKTINNITLGGGVISYDIKGTMAGMALSYLTNTVGAFDGRYCYWAITTGSSTVNNKIIVLDTWGVRKYKQVTIYPWTTMSSKNAAFLTTSTIPGYQNVYYASTSSTSGLVYKFDSSVYTDEGSNITMTVNTRDFMLDPSRKTHWKYLYFKFDTGVNSNLTVGARVDKAQNFTTQESVSMAGNSPGLGPTGTFTLGTSKLGGAALNEHRTNIALSPGHMLGIQFSETSASSVGIYEFSIYGMPKPLRAS